MLMLDASAGALDYLPCRYGTSKAVFRGPERDLSRPYVAMLGGSATFGKYVERPYPALVEAAIGLPVANLAGLNAGPDFYLSDPATLDVAAGARAAVVQVTGAEALSNPFYTVHGRRNDRFVAAAPRLHALFPRVDFTDIHFTRHLMQVLQRADTGRFAELVHALQQNWLVKMRQVLSRLPARRILLWLADTTPPGRAESLDCAPLFIDRGLIDALRFEVSAVVHAVPSPRARAMAPFDMTYAETEAAQAACLPGAAVHSEVADRLASVLHSLLRMEKGPPFGDPP
ncbi:MAG: hypothetical protein J0L76_20700 [Rhodobacterales bacterium]|nr:hypothetical protein [Rhodobacterales bacterium]